MLFKDLNITKPLQRALDDLGYKEATPIQEKAFPVIMSGKDTIAIAQTGTGKTFAYLLPLLRQLTFSEQKQPRILIAVPTRELVVQVVEEAKKLASYTSVRIGGIYGGANINTQKQLIFDGLDILVSTPGRLIDMIHTRTLQVNSIQKLVIDEVDEMFNLGFRAQVLAIMDLLPKKRQNLLFSATLDEDLEKLIADYFVQPQYVELVARGTPIEKIVQLGYDVPNFHTKINLFEHLLLKDDQLKKTLVFVKNKKLADLLYKELNERFPDEISIIHSNKTQPQRFAAIKNFDDGTHKVLIATDIIARGLDIPEVSHVINFDTPSEAADYIHRIGRTGRANSIGNAITFVTPKEKPFQEKIEQLMNNAIPMAELPEEVEVSDILIADEKTAKPDKNLKKISKMIVQNSGGAFHEKKAKNKKVNLGGKRRQERQKRKEEKFRRNRGI
ncbi:MAG: DEAD/DEAH box helicase [Sphingobacteriaceae bacterium]